jgi:chromosomal replication initiator protein
MEITAPELWTQVLEAARPGLPEQSFRTWLAGTEAVGLSGQVLEIETPSQFHVEWIEDKYGAVLNQILEHLSGRPMTLRFHAGQEGPTPIPAVEVEPEGVPAPPGSASTTTPPSAAAPPSPSSMGLNDRYTFQRYVVGDNSELASAACHAVASNPGRTYNPLFLYGGVGLGKTHLMHAIGNEILDRTPETRIAYLPCERFVNDLVTSIQEGTTAEFRRRYREIDLLLVDDVHFLEGKERTQEEFFHTFNALHDARKQIILTSDRPPKEIPGLEARLISRFEWGLVVDVKVPDFETRMAILRKKAADDDLILDEDVIEYIARHCRDSVRELEGAVIKLLAYSSLTNQEISISMAESALRGVLGGRADRHRPISPDRIAEEVAEEWSVTREALSSKRRSRDIMVPRQVAMYLIKEILDLPLVRIGQLFGGRDHSTVIHSIRKVEEGMAEDDAFRSRVARLRKRLDREV